jgi:uncharacterized YigZ family protein
MQINSIEKNTHSKLVDKKSIFYGYAIKIKNEKEIKDILKKIKKEQTTSNHIAYSYSITKLDKNKKIITIQKYSDAGEPNKTAGFPLLNLLKSKKITNVILIVARIFGGIKLGTKGLIKAYSNTGELALNKTKITKEIITIKHKIKTDIKKYNKIKLYLDKNKIKYNTIFDKNIIIEIKIPTKNEEPIIKKIKELNKYH